MSSATLSLGDVLRRASEHLDKTSETGRLDAELLLAHTLDRPRIELYTDLDRPLNEDELDRYRELVARRSRCEPVAYILGEWGFRRLTLDCDPRALIPRPETEIVVERCLERLRGLHEPRVLDVGAGTGAIALAIADEHPGARVTGIDASPDALALARTNAERTGLDVELRPGGFETAAEGSWELVVANPPYVLPDEYESLQPEVRDWEPRGALVGVGLHRELASVAATRWLVLEVADGQAPTVAGELRELGYADVTITRDLADRERVVEGRRG